MYKRKLKPFLKKSAKLQSGEQHIMSVLKQNDAGVGDSDKGVDNLLSTFYLSFLNKGICGILLPGEMVLW